MPVDNPVRTIVGNVDESDAPVSAFLSPQLIGVKRPLLSVIVFGPLTPAAAVQLLTFSVLPRVEYTTSDAAVESVAVVSTAIRT